MEISVNNKITLMLAALFVLFYRTTGEISLTVNVDDLDPLKECMRRDVILAESNNKVYMYGGQSWISNSTSSPIVGANHYLRIADFTSARNMNDSAILTAKDIDRKIPIFRSGAFWSDSDTLYVVSGTVVSHPYLTQDGEFIKTDWPLWRAGTVFQYDINADEWTNEPALQLDRNNPVNGTFASGAFAWNTQQRKAYYYSGGSWPGGTKLDPNATPVDIGPTAAESKGNGNLLSFNTETFEWSNQTTDNTLTTTWTEDGQFVFLPGTETSEGGIGIVIGGVEAIPYTMVSLRKVLVYDSRAGSWYSQHTTAEGGQFPPERKNYCAVAVSAADNSSHNIYIYGGEAPGQLPDAFSDMWILSIPSFHWIPVDVESVPRKSVGCTGVAGRYMVTYGGHPAGWGLPSDNEIAQCDQENYGLRLFDLSALSWQPQYDGPENSAYTVPSVVYKAIGGTKDRAATQTAPSIGFDTPELESLFNKSDKTSPLPSPEKASISAIAGGVISGIAFLVVLVGGAWLLLKRRKTEAVYAFAATSTSYEADDSSRKLSELHSERWEGKGVYEMGGRETRPVTPPLQELDV